MIPRARCNDDGRFLKTIFSRQQGAVILFVWVFVMLASLTRVSLLFFSRDSVSWNASLGAAFVWGTLYDAGAALLAALPISLVLSALPNRGRISSVVRVLAPVAAFALLAALIFGAVAEMVFWEEFGGRFNFIAVDYLVYTTEVIGNIRESYDLPIILGVVVALAAVAQGLLLRSQAWRAWRAAPPERAINRFAGLALHAGVVLLIGLGLSESSLPSFENNYNRELGKNGLWSLFSAFRSNELDYYRFYRTLPDREAFDRITLELAEDGSKLLNPAAFDTLRSVTGVGHELHLNVIQVTVESLSAEFLGCFNPSSKLTPELDALVGKSLVFENFYATGTRTDRGMEALTLSLPPTPGFHCEATQERSPVHAWFGFPQPRIRHRVFIRRLRLFRQHERLF